MHTNNQNDWNAYKRKRNEVTSILRTAERNYWKSSLDEAKQSGSKDFWKIVRRLTGKEKDNKKIGPIENDEKVLVYTDKEKAEAFNNYFTDIGKNLASQFPLPDQSDYSYITRVRPTLSDVSNILHALTKQLDKMKPGKAPGSDKITPRELLMGKDELNHSLYSLCYHSMKSRQFPSEYKIGKLRLSFKKGRRVDRGNYRPLSMLCTPGKIIESVICTNVDSHLETSPNPHQWGYKKGIYLLR